MSLPEASIPSGILFCDVCRKPFTQKTALGRHTTYCRRTRNRPRVRPRPCQECKASKSKCSLAPRCARCDKKGLRCAYTEADAEISGQVEDAVVRVPLATLMSPSDRHVISSISSFDAAEDPLWSPSQRSTPLVFEDFFDTSAHMVVSPRIRNNNGSEFSMDWLRLMNGNELSIPGPINDCIISPHSQVTFPLACIRPPSPLATAHANIIKQSLSAYPQMMLRRSTFPPFIHPLQDKGHLPEPLANCMAIAALFASRNDDTRSFLWKAIKDEQQRCLQEMATYSKFEIFAALQAAVIYLTMRIVDGCNRSDQDPIYNTEILWAYKHFWKQYILVTASEHCGGTKASSISGWEEWVLEESRIRLICVFYLVAQISCVRIGIPCTFLDEWRNLPLPCHAARWAATTPGAWKEETDALEDIVSRGCRPETFGELVDLQRVANRQGNADRLETWNAGSDNLCVLLNLASVMV